MLALGCAEGSLHPSHVTSHSHIPMLCDNWCQTEEGFTGKEPNGHYTITVYVNKYVTSWDQRHSRVMCFMQTTTL